ncbi:hypothetical protein [Streptomyces qinglanensis]|uniref:hypothetical protein n=1 Tax=Streptomyces qinglanensis TaxID=943816 RepID=UPI003D743ADA
MNPVHVPEHDHAGADRLSGGHRVTGSVRPGPPSAATVHDRMRDRLQGRPRR